MHIHSALHEQHTSVVLSPQKLVQTVDTASTPYPGKSRVPVFDGFNCKTRYSFRCPRVRRLPRMVGKIGFSPISPAGNAMYAVSI